MDKEIFVKPVVEIIEIDNSDVVMASTQVGGNGDFIEETDDDATGKIKW